MMRAPREGEMRGKKRKKKAKLPWPFLCGLDGMVWTKPWLLALFELGMSESIVVASSSRFSRRVAAAITAVRLRDVYFFPPPFKFSYRLFSSTPCLPFPYRPLVKQGDEIIKKIPREPKSRLD